MQLCESCGACREDEWSLCPFCRASLTSAEAPTPTSSNASHFNALAAAAETSELDVLPSLIADDEPEPEPDDALITAQDLAHLTGDSRVAVNGWDSPAPAAPTAPIEAPDGIDAPVSRAVVIPLVLVALAAVVVVAYSIVTASPSVRPDTVALIDRPTTTTVVSTTTTEASGPGAIGDDIAEQAAWLCAGDQFTIARAEAPSLATYNDVLVATQDGRDDWSAPADHETLLGPVPSLIGCLSTADGGEIDQCPDIDTVISRRSVDWTYRVLQSSDGATLDQDQGTASDVRPCDELQAEAGDADSASWSPLPQERFRQVAVAYTSAPHPQSACMTSEQESSTELIPFAQGASVHAMFDGVTDTEVSLPTGWRATDERPVEVLLCFENLSGEVGPTADSPPEDARVPPAAETTCDVTTRVHAMHRDGRMIGSFDHVSSSCTETGETVAPPQSWLASVVGPAIGYELEEAETEGS